jgi:hypothetical protein
MLCCVETYYISHCEAGHMHTMLHVYNTRLTAVVLLYAHVQNKSTTLQILERAGVQLSQQDLQRLASRFDIHDDGFISTQLFIHFIDGSNTVDTTNNSSSKASRNQSAPNSSRKHNSSEHNEHNDSEGMKFNDLMFVRLKFDNCTYCTVVSVFCSYTTL